MEITFGGSELAN